MAVVSNFTDDIMQRTIDAINKKDDTVSPSVPKMNGLNSEYANSNKWYGYFPLANVLGKNYSDLELSLTRFALPQMEMGSTETAFKGYTYQFPNHLLDSGDKQLTLDYIVDARWVNYRSLFKWCSAFEGQINQVIDTSDVSNITVSDFIDCRIYLLDHFKNRIISFTFHNCWLKLFGDLALESNNPDEVHHSITIQYSHYTIDDM